MFILVASGSQATKTDRSVEPCHAAALSRQLKTALGGKI